MFAEGFVIKATSDRRTHIPISSCMVFSKLLDRKSILYTEPTDNTDCEAFRKYTEKHPSNPRNPGTKDLKSDFAKAMFHRA